MVHRHDAVRGQVVADLTDGFLGEQEALEPQRGLARERGEGVRDREEHQVERPIGVVQERSAVLDVRRHPGVLVRPVRVQVASQAVQQRVDLDRVDVVGPLGQCDGDVVAAARIR